MSQNKSSTLSIFSLVMLITVSIDSIRNLPLAAVFGSQLIFFFIVAALVFLIPTGFIAAELTAANPDHHGIYDWVKKAFGQHCGFFAIWLQWINTLVWYPTTLAFIAGSSLYLINPQLAKNPAIIVAIVVTIFWLLTIINLRGFESSTKFASFCAIIGMIIPMTVIIVLAILWLSSGHQPQIHWHQAKLIPNLSRLSSWTSMVAIVTSFLGMELISSHTDKIDQPARKIPLAIIISAAIILITMLVGSLAVASVIPAHKINLVDGVMQVISYLLQDYHLAWLKPLLGIMIIVGGLGSMINWMISPAAGLLCAAKDGYLPPSLGKINRHRVASRILILQATLVSLAAAAFVLLPSINQSYWLLTDLSTELYVAMYLLMFLAALTLYIKKRSVSSVLSRVGGKWALWLLCTLGAIGCLITLVSAFIPPSNIYVSSQRHFLTLFISGLVIMLLPALFGFAHKKSRS